MKTTKEKRKRERKETGFFSTFCFFHCFFFCQRRFTTTTKALWQVVLETSSSYLIALKKSAKWTLLLTKTFLLLLQNREYYKFNEVDHRLDPLFASEVIDNWILDLRRMKMVTVIDLGCNAGDLTIQFYDQLTQRISNGIQNSNGEKGELEGGDLCGSHKRKRNEEECREPPKKTRESEGFGGDQKEELLLHQESLEKTEQPISKKEEKEGSCFVDDGCSDKILIPNESSLPSLSFLGIDLDSSLIKRAQQQVGSRNITFKTGNLMESDGQEIIQNFLKQNGVESFSLCLCFSITMWVHLNHGDVGLITFLTSLSSFSQNLVIEPQPWKCYKVFFFYLLKESFFRQILLFFFYSSSVFHLFLFLIVKNGS